jgi:hypothetical protein
LGFGHSPALLSSSAVLIRVVSLCRLPDNAARPAAAPRVLARPAEVPQTPFWILLIKRSPNRLLGDRLLRRAFRSTRLPRCTRFLCHVISPHSEHGTLPHFSQQFTAAKSGNSHAGSVTSEAKKKPAGPRRTRPASIVSNFLTSLYFFD